MRGVKYLRKATMQLASKMRFISAQFEALLGTDLWLRNAGHANAMAQRLYQAVKDVEGLEIPRPVQANQVFAILPTDVTERLQKRFRFYTWNEQHRRGPLDDLLRHRRAGHRRLRRRRRRRARGEVGPAVAVAARRPASAPRPPTLPYAAFGLATPGPDRVM